MAAILIAIIVHKATIINISDYKYPTRTNNHHTAVLIATNDIHGYAKGFHMKDPHT